MAVTDRWHKTYPDPKVDQPCKKCGSAKHPVYPTAEHPRPAQDGKRAKRGGKRWQVRYRDDTGKQCSKNFTLKEGKNPELHADAFDAKVNAELDADDYIDPRAGDITLKEYATEWRRHLTVDASTMSWIDPGLARIYSHKFSEAPMGRLSKRPSLVKSWISALSEDGLLPSTVKLYFGMLSRIFAAAVEDEIIRKNPCRAKTIRLPIVSKEEVVPLTLAQTTTIRENLPKRYQALVDLGVGAGLRQGEMLAFSPDDVDWFQLMVKVQRQIKVVKNVHGKGVLIFALPKYDKVRTVPLSKRTAEVLAAHLQAFPAADITLPWDKPDGEPTKVKLMFTWTGPRGVALAEGITPKPIHRAGLNPLWQHARGVAGLPHDRKYGMHVARHTFASASLAGGVDLKRLSMDLGHSSITTTDETYSHLMPNTEGRVRTAVDAFFSGAFETPSASDVPAGPLATILSLKQRSRA